MKKILIAAVLLSSSFNNAAGLPNFESNAKKAVEKIIEYIDSDTLCRNKNKSALKKLSGISENIKAIVELACNEHTERTKYEDILIDAIQKRHNKKGISGEYRQILEKIVMKAKDSKILFVKHSFERIAKETGL